ncbi:MAG: energy-coupling factor transporter ATPase [Candidatus Izimaplasma sp.]|nr:energy-coupling factor transporter ATPase [Candidatus Izimaplasma bacterium]
MYMITVEHVSFDYHSQPDVLKDVSFTIDKGRWVSILGHNGSGKSTLAKLIVGLLKAKEGSITVDGIVLNEETVYQVRKKVGIVFQNPDNQFVGVTVEDDIAFGMENLCFTREEITKRIDKYAKQVGMEDYLSKEPHQLSGGQKQRVAIAGILAMDTDIIIFDEATSMLDPIGRDEILAFMQQLKHQGKTIITITHDMKEAVLSDEIIDLKEGQLLTHDKTKKVLQDKVTLNKSNLELLPSLKLYHKIKEAGIVNEELRDYLWQLSLQK